MEKCGGDAAYLYVRACGKHFDVITVYGFYVDLAIQKQCEIWMLKMNFVSGSSCLMKGTERLEIGDAVNRVIEKLI